MKFSEHSRRMHDWLEYQWLLYQNNEPRVHESLCKPGVKSRKFGSLRWISEELAREGILNRNGKPYGPQSVKLMLAKADRRLK